MAEDKCGRKLAESHLHRKRMVAKSFPTAAEHYTFQHCGRELVSRAAYDLSPTRHRSPVSIEVKEDGDIYEITGEFTIPKRLAEKYAQKISEITAPGFYGEEAKPCKVVETHHHRGIEHLHFKCAPYTVRRGQEDEFWQLVKLAREREKEELD